MKFCLERKRSKTLIAGPYVGEFGWELMAWQGYVRKLSKYYKKTISISYSSSKYLYNFCEFYPHSLQLENSKFDYGNYNHESNEKLVSKIVQLYNINEYDVFTPKVLLGYKKYFIGNQSFKKFYEKPYNNRIYDLVFHFRNLIREDGTYKNYETYNADIIVKYYKDRNFKVCCIGLPSLSYSSPYCDNCQSDDLKYTISILSNCSLVIGGSSAPMHLASLCDTPIVVWIGPPFTAERYFSYWNPFKSKVYLVTENSFNPNPENVIKKINEALFELNY